MTGSKRWFVIINPTSGNGSCNRKWTDIQKLLISNKFNFEFVFTQYQNHSFELTQGAIKQGFRDFICVGGDGTLHNIINGIMDQKEVLSTDIHVGIIPIGTGNDWVKTHQIPNQLEKAIEIIKKGSLKIQDVGKIDLIPENKRPVYFINLAGIGFDGYVVSKVNKYKHLGTLAYLAGAFLGLFSFQNFRSKVSVNAEQIESKTLMILVGICKYSGGGMQLTETSNPFDGILDISIVKDIGKWDIIKNLPKLFNGKITSHKKVETYKTTSVSIDLLDTKKPFIQADGELIGTGNIEVSIIQKAFSFYA
ncbi:diacylglycerol/lipid kinase family protein [Bizionia arctica]|uniref:Diacylglycerol kinase n=1 Tax=Bizionia arctica TaxID=1495645 RepID=A0A917GC77_9FLAO|nr:diacylglycerol kinase family protein [Bizionia arctica]GGG36776.1 diacylglycerol kinase [Bizionia arctica]